MVKLLNCSFLIRAAKNAALCVTASLGQQLHNQTCSLQHHRRKCLPTQPSKLVELFWIVNRVYWINWWWQNWWCFEYFSSTMHRLSIQPTWREYATALLLCHTIEVLWCDKVLDLVIWAIHLFVCFFESYNEIRCENKYGKKTPLNSMILRCTKNMSMVLRCETFCVLT